MRVSKATWTGPGGVRRYRRAGTRDRRPPDGSRSRPSTLEWSPGRAETSRPHGRIQSGRSSSSASWAIFGGAATSLGTCGWNSLALSDEGRASRRSARPLRWHVAWRGSAALLSMRRASRRRSSQRARRSRRHSCTERSLRSMRSSASSSTMLSRNRSMRGRLRPRRRRSATTRLTLPGCEARG